MRAGLRRAYVVHIADGAEGAHVYPQGDSGKIGDYLDLRKHEGRGAHGIYVRYLDQEDGSPVVGPVPVLQWLAAPPPPEPTPLTNAAPAMLSGMAAMADAAVNAVTPSFLKPTTRAWGARWIPRVGTEVLVAHYGGGTELPVIVGSLFTADIPRRFPPTADVTSIVPADDPKLEIPNEGAAEPRDVTAKGQDLSYLDASIRRPTAKRNWPRNMILFDDADEADGSDSPTMVFHTEGDMWLDVRGFLKYDLKDGGYKTGNYYHHVGGTFRNVVHDITCATVIRDVEARTQGDAYYELTGLEFILALQSLSSVSYAFYKSVEWSLSVRFVMPTYTECTVGKQQSLSILHIIKPTNTYDVDHQGDHMVLKLLDYKEMGEKTDVVKTNLGLELISKITSAAATRTKDMELKLSLKRELEMGTQERKGLMELKIAQTCEESVGYKLEV